LSISEKAMLFPIALDLRGKRCVVVGGGAVGERKARALAAAGADVGVVAPEVTDGLSDFIHEGGAAHVNRTFLPQHLDGAFLVIAATDRPEVNAEVARAARARRLLVNLAAPAAAASAETGDEDGGEAGIS
jgi:siroheme synthase-like protein